MDMMYARTASIMLTMLLLKTGCGWNIHQEEADKIVDVKTRCSLRCPFQNQTTDLYVEDITCDMDCKIQMCIKGCQFLEQAMKDNCENLCKIPNNKKIENRDLYCFIGCRETVNMYFASISDELSNLQPPVLQDHTLTSTSLSLEWNEINFSNESYILQCCNVDVSNIWQFCRNQTWTTPKIVRIENLQPFTKYQFRVAIRLTPGDWYEIYSGPSSIIATLPGGIPFSPPTIVSVVPVQSSIVSVTWQEDYNTNGPIVSYILQFAEIPVGYSAVKDIPATKKVHSFMIRNLKPSTNYTISVSARNVVGLGPAASVVVRTHDPTRPVDLSAETFNLLIATEHTVYSINSYAYMIRTNQNYTGLRDSSTIEEDPVLLYNTTHSIYGVGLHIHRELLFISDSSGSVIGTSSKGLLTPQEVLPPTLSKRLALTVDWLNDHLYILNEILHPSGSIVYGVARCNLDGSNLKVVISGFIMKPHHIEVDPYNGYLFWVVRGAGLYRLDLNDISRTINSNVSPDLIFEDSNLGAFLIHNDLFRIIIPDHSKNAIISMSLDGQDVINFRESVENPKLRNVVSSTLIDDTLYWTDGEQIYLEIWDALNSSYVHAAVDKLSNDNYVAVLANVARNQKIPIPVNEPTEFQAIFGYDLAKVSWKKPFLLAGQGEGAWSSWLYRLLISEKNGSKVSDVGDIRTSQYTVSGLKSGTEYVLQVCPYTASGEGPCSVQFRGKTLRTNTSLFWSNDKGLLQSDLTGYRVTKIEPVNYVQTDSRFVITDIDWFDDLVYVSTNTKQVFWYNLTSNTYGQVQDINNVDCIAVDWLAHKLYWATNRNKMIFRSNFNGTKQEMVPIIAAAQTLFLDSSSAHIYWSTIDKVERSFFNGTNKKVYYTARPYSSQIVGLSIDLERLELYWVERSTVYPRRSALMITNAEKSVYNQEYNFHMDKYNLINQDVEGGLCYVDQHLVWVRANDKNAMISGLNGTTTAIIHSDNLANLVTCTARDFSVRLNSKKTVIPDPVSKSSLRIKGPYYCFNITWDPVQNVDCKVHYRVKVTSVESENLVETTDTYWTMKNRKAYIPLKIVIQSWTEWATADPTYLTLHSPTSTPSSPLDPRIFISPEKRAVDDDKKVSIIFRWSPPREPNGIIQHYELSCWVLHNRTDTPSTVCSSSQISAKTLEFTLQNLQYNKTYFFQVRGCTSSGCGNWSDTVQTDFDKQVPVPKLLLISTEGLSLMDYDRRTFGMVMSGTSGAKSVTYSGLAPLEYEGVSITYDWISRNLFWIELMDNFSIINNLDLNYNEEDRLVHNLFKRPATISSILCSPFHSLLVWIEIDMNTGDSSLMKSNMNGSHIREFFNHESVVLRNDLSSAFPNIDEPLCNCTKYRVGKSVTTFPTIQNGYFVLFVDENTSHIMSTDFEGCYCTKLFKTNRISGLPMSMTADFKNLYWIDSKGVSLYALPLEYKTNIKSIEITPTNGGGMMLKRIVTYNFHLQLYPDKKCLFPNVKPGIVHLVKFSSDSITLKFPKIENYPYCKNVSLATIEYTLYYGTIEDNGTSNCTSDLKTCFQLISFDKIKKVNKLKPYTRYVFSVAISNYYSSLHNTNITLSDPAVYRTAPGVPSEPRNVKAIPVLPNAVMVKWSPPEQINAEAVRYTVYCYTKYSNGTEDLDFQSPIRRHDTFDVIKRLLPAHNYIVWVVATPVVNGRSLPSLGHSTSENATVTTFPEPGNLILIGATSYSLNISIPPINNTRFEIEFYDQLVKKWHVIPRSNNEFVILSGLLPLNTYKIRLKIFYTVFYSTPYNWPTNGIEFKTIGDRPSTPGTPVLQNLKDDMYQIVWEPSHNYGADGQTYWLEGKQVESDSNRKDIENSNRYYSDWSLYYNGTDNFWLATGIKQDTMYIFRVRARNEYGWSDYSEVSDPSEIPSSSLLLFVLTFIITPLCSIALLFVFLGHAFVRRRSNEKAKQQRMNELRGDFELMALRELPSMANFVQTENELYETEAASDESLKMIQVRREQITLTKFLGSGAFGEVYEGSVKNLLYENIDTQVAIKAIRKNATEQEKSEFLKEALLMSKFKHKHILQLLGICVDNNPYFLIMELMEGGDLLSYLRSNRLPENVGGLTLPELLSIGCDVAKGCCYLEEMHFVHRDLACRNCLVSNKEPANRIVKIGDFGLTRDIYKNDYYRKEGEGLLPVRWMAPESLVDGVFTRNSDVWSFGVLLWEIMTLGQQPYQARSNVEVLQYVRGGGRLTKPPKCPQEMYALMERCWNFEPKGRPTFHYCLTKLEDLQNAYSSSICNRSYYTTVISPADHDSSNDDNKTDSNNTDDEDIEETNNND